MVVLISVSRTVNWHSVQRSLNGHPKDYLKDGQPDWDMPEISKRIADGLKIAFTRNERLSPPILYALIVKLLAQGHILDSNTNDRNLLLDILCAAARQGHRPSRSMIFRVHKYFDSLPPPDISSAKLSWIAESVSEGAFFLRSELQQMDAGLLKESVTSFRNSGKLHFCYATSSSAHPSGIAQSFSQDEHYGSELTGPLNSHVDNASHNAAISNQSSAFSELLCPISLEDINALNTHGETPLYRACMVGLTSDVLQLLSRGAEASTRASEEGPGCLHWIFQFDASDINLVVDELISHGASIHVQSKQKITIPYPPFTLPVGTALHWAVEMSVPEAVTALLRKGADPCLRDGRDPYEYDESVRHLDRILPPDNTPFCVAERPTMGLNAFDLAVQNRDHTILNILFSKVSVNVADQVDEEGHSALHRLDGGHWLSTRHGTRIWKPCLEGSRQKQKEAATLTVNLLHDRGFELDRLSEPQKCAHSGIDFFRLSPLMMAIKRCCVDSVEALIEAGANVECVDNQGRTALHAFRASYRDLPNLQSAMITTLLHSKPDVNVRDMDGDSPLAVAARQGLPEVGLALLEHGADFCVRGGTPGDLGFGQNVLAMFCSCEINETHERDEWMAMLLARFVFPRLQEGNKRIKEEMMTNAGNNGGNFLHFTASSGLQKCCRLLLEEGVVDCNQLRIGKKIRWRDSVRGIVTHYRTPLDEVIKEAKSAKRRSRFSERGMCPRRK